MISEDKQESSGNVTQPLQSMERRGRGQVIEDVIEDVQPLKKKAGAEIQDGRNIGKLGSQDRRWKRTQGAINRSLQDKGETLPSMRKGRMAENSEEPQSQRWIWLG